MDTIDCSDEIRKKYYKFQSQIESCLSEKDIYSFMEDMESLFTDGEKRFIMDSSKNERVTNFLLCFDKLRNPSKYITLKTTAEKYNKWIFIFLDFNINDGEEVLKLKATWAVLENFVKLIKQLKHTFKLSDIFVNHLYRYDILSNANKDKVIQSLSNEGEATAMFELFKVVSKKDPDWYGHILYVIAREDSYFIHILCDDLESIAGLSEAEKKQKCMVYAKKFIETHVEQYLTETSAAISHKVEKKNFDEETCSDYGSISGDDIENDTLFELDLPDDDHDGLADTLEESPAELTLKNFQLELIEPAIRGTNAIVYAPTGSGKTNVAVYIANDHLKKNRKGKVLFLVHRTPLVTQQYRVFKKYTDPGFDVIHMRKKSESSCGPLIALMETSDIIIMTSDVLRNALMVDDGNKISSICEFSLIFFDECHNCMKSHPYTKIMQHYFKEKRENPSKKLPQIVGLTASPRSNRRDDIPGMKKCLFELCANLDCCRISMVTQHKADLEKFLAQPKQTVVLTENRKHDEFEKSLLKQMEFCERKLEKMQKERYFAPGALSSIPTNKYKQEYVGFVGNLERLNTVTVDECDGKQKAYSIFRYLNAFYRGLIVNQMFNEHYAKKSIRKYLCHNGVDFTCSFDEEFYTNYEAEILTNIHTQSANPAIDKIIAHIIDQLDAKEDSRILIFVREKDFTTYLVDILKKNGIAAEAIIGSNAKSDVKTCTASEIDNILHRFKSGKTRVLVSTTVVEEGLDVVNCNMVISYGHVTNETAMVQRRGRVRTVNSTYLLILPPMLAWLAKKEHINERRKELMMKLIDQIQYMDNEEMEKFVFNYQKSKFLGKEKRSVTMIQKDAWKFTCKNCQTYICSSHELRIIENAHRISIIPELLHRFKVVKEPRVSFGAQDIYEFGGKVLCNKCNNYVLGNYVYYKKIPFFQLAIGSCNGTDVHGRVRSFKKWADFAKLYEIPSLVTDDCDTYLERMEHLV